MTLSSRAILVLGMHRSGTSAVTRVLNLLGVDLGASVLPPVANDNDMGFWEHRDAFDTHERLLEGLGRSWHDVRDLPDGWLESPAAARARTEIGSLIGREFAGSPLWGVKDPRMCRLASIWLRALGDAGAQPGIVLVVRHPLEVVDSLHARNGWARAHSLLMWTQHLVEAERATRDAPRVLVTYDDVLADWSKTAARIEQALEVSWPRNPEDARADIEAFLDVGARHHTLPVPADGGLAGVPPIVAALYDACVALAGSRGTWAELGARAEEFRQVAALYGPCISDFVAYAEATREHAERAETVLALGDLRHNVDVMRQNLDATRQKVDTMFRTLTSQRESMNAIQREMLRPLYPWSAIIRRLRHRG